MFLLLELGNMYRRGQFVYCCLYRYRSLFLRLVHHWSWTPEGKFTTIPMQVLPINNVLQPLTQLHTLQLLPHYWECGCVPCALQLVIDRLIKHSNSHPHASFAMHGRYFQLVGIICLLWKWKWHLVRVVGVFLKRKGFIVPAGQFWILKLYQSILLSWWKLSRSNIAFDSNQCRWSVRGNQYWMFNWHHPRRSD